MISDLYWERFVETYEGTEKLVRTEQGVVQARTIDGGDSVVESEASRQPDRSGGSTTAPEYGGQTGVVLHPPSSKGSTLRVGVTGGIGKLTSSKFASGPCPDHTSGSERSEEEAPVTRQDIARMLPPVKESTVCARVRSLVRKGLVEEVYKRAVTLGDGRQVRRGVLDVAEEVDYSDVEVRGE